MRKSEFDRKSDKKEMGRKRQNFVQSKSNR